MEPWISSVLQSKHKEEEKLQQLQLLQELHNHTSSLTLADQTSAQAERFQSHSTIGLHYDTCSDIT